MDIKLPSLSHRSNKPANVPKPTINDKHVELNCTSIFPYTYVAAHWSVWSVSGRPSAQPPLQAVCQL